MNVKSTGIAFIQSVIVNAVIPVVYCYGREQHDAAMMDRAISWLNQLPAEQNTIATRFQKLGMTIDNAFKSQGALELKHTYCDQKLCLQCTIGKKLLAFN